MVTTTAAEQGYRVAGISRRVLYSVIPTTPLLLLQPPIITYNYNTICPCTFCSFTIAITLTGRYRLFTEFIPPYFSVASSPYICRIYIRVESLKVAWRQDFFQRITHIICHLDILRLRDVRQFRIHIL